MSTSRADPPRGRPSDHRRRRPRARGARATHPHLREALGADAVRGVARPGPDRRGSSQRPRTTDERRRTRTPQGAWWGTQTVNVRDRATATLPALLYERMDELGIDFTVLYPTNTLLTLRRGGSRPAPGPVRRVQRVLRRRLRPVRRSDDHGRHRSRCTRPRRRSPSCEHCHELGIKVVCFPEGVLRPLDRARRPDCIAVAVPGPGAVVRLASGSTASTTTTRCGRRASELGFAVTFHGGLTVRPGIHWSITQLRGEPRRPVRGRDVPARARRCCSAG